MATDTHLFGLIVSQFLTLRSVGFDISAIEAEWPPQRSANGRETADEEDENQEFIDVLNDIEEFFSESVF